MEALTKECDRVAKKQRTCAARSLEGVGRLLEECTAARAELLACPNAEAQAAALRRLHTRLEDVDFAGQVSTQQKDLQGALVKLGKGIEKTDGVDLEGALRDSQFDQDTLNTVVAQHLLREGNFELASAFVQEASITMPAAYQEPYMHMHGVLQHIKAHHLAPAIAWARQQRATHDREGLASLEFRLHRMRFMQLLQDEAAGAGGSRTAAMLYARAHLAAFAGDPAKMAELRRLMGALLYAGRLQASPYTDLLAPVQWANVQKDFVRVCCAALGQAQDSPLAVAVKAGELALPTLLKMASVMAGKSHGEDWASCTQLPVEIALGSEFVFHSIFACPVSRDQSTADNPPMLLPCGHVLCKVSITSLAKGSINRPFKCPYCPNETTVFNCKQLHF